MKLRAGPAWAGALALLAACSGSTTADAGADLGVDAGDDASAAELGVDGGDPLAGCVVECVAIHPGEYRAECHGTGCPMSAFPVCDQDAAPPDARDGGLLVAPVCARPSVAGEVDRVAACAIDGVGIATLTGPPVVVCAD